MPALIKTVLEALIWQEKSGYAFYETAADTVEDARVKKLFKRLGKDEVRHERTFAKLLERAPEIEVELEENEQAYLQLLLARLAPNTSKNYFKAEGAISKDDALDIAEGLERNSVLLLGEILSLDARLLSEKVLTVALNEERGHLRDILQMRMDDTVGSLML